MRVGKSSTKNAAIGPYTIVTDHEDEKDQDRHSQFIADLSNFAG
jgi:hypothetical protein